MRSSSTPSAVVPRDPGGTIQFGVGHLPRSVTRALELARVAEEAGIGWFGVADSPYLFGSCYPAVQHILSGTATLRVGPLVVNPVNRDPSVHAADLAALNELGPGRVFMGMGAGDSALHSIGLAPARREEVASAIGRIRKRVGDDMLLLSAASGPHAAREISRAANGVVVAGGLHVPWLTELIALAETAAGTRLHRWLLVPSSIVRSEADVIRARSEVRGSVMAVARHALGGRPATRGVPVDLAGDIADLFAQYDFGAHAMIGSRNDLLLADHPRLERYLVDRFSLTGTAEQAAPRLAEVIAGADLDGVFLSTNVVRPEEHIRLIGEVLLPRVRDLLHASR